MSSFANPRTSCLGRFKYLRLKWRHMMATYQSPFDLNAKTRCLLTVKLSLLRLWYILTYVRQWRVLGASPTITVHSGVTSILSRICCVTESAIVRMVHTRTTPGLHFLVMFRPRLLSYLLEIAALPISHAQAIRASGGLESIATAGYHLGTTGYLRTNIGISS